ncbi:MAG: histidinol-phosphate transaminase [Treponema sp.]|nr:histidinol-phosphate transaminase [Treponema sp.]
MSLYWNEKTRNLQPYVPGEQPKDKKLIKLNTNENPYPPSPKAIEAIKKAAAESLRLYPDPACTELRETAAARYGLDAAQVFAGNGSDEILAFAFAAFFDTSHDAEPILFPDITYSFYPVYAALWGIPCKTIPLGEDFSIDTAPYLEKSGGVIIANPNAPTAIALSVEELKRIAEAAGRNRRVLIADEAYIAFAGGQGLGGSFASMLPFINEFPNLLVIRTLSKDASLAGLRTGFAFGNAELIEGLCRIRDSFNSYTLDRLALAGAAAAIKDASYYDEINSRIIATRGRVASGLETLGFRVLPSQANFLFASPPAIGGKEFFTALRERGILVRHFNKERIADFLRISIGTDDEMDVFLEACKEIIK